MMYTYTAIEQTCKAGQLESDCDGLVTVTTGRMLTSEAGGQVYGPFPETRFVTAVEREWIESTPSTQWEGSKGRYESRPSRDARVDREARAAGLSARKRQLLRTLIAMRSLHSQEASFFARGSRIVMMTEFVFHTRKEADKVRALREVCKAHGSTLVKVTDRSDGDEGCANYEALLNVSDMTTAEARRAKLAFYKAAGPLMGWCLRSM